MLKVPRKTFDLPACLSTANRRMRRGQIFLARQGFFENSAAGVFAACAAQVNIARDLSMFASLFKVKSEVAPPAPMSPDQLDLVCRRLILLGMPKETCPEKWCRASCV